MDVSYTAKKIGPISANGVMQKIKQKTLYLFFFEGKLRNLVTSSMFKFHPDLFAINSFWDKSDKILVKLQGNKFDLQPRVSGFGATAQLNGLTYFAILPSQLLACHWIA